MTRISKKSRRHHREAMQSNCSARIATSAATRHGGTHWGNQLLRAKVAHAETKAI